jgi:NADH-quinone oxidoreductase subunit M
MAFPLLSAIWLAPLLAALAVLAQSNPKTIRLTALAGALAAMGLVLVLALGCFDVSRAGSYQLSERLDLLRQAGGLNLSYRLGVDGMSLVLLLLTGIIITTGVLVSWNVTHRAREFFFLLLLLVSGVFGVFMATELFTFFVFYEIAVLPMYLLIGIWGTGPKEYSAMKLTLMLMGGSALVMLGMLALYWQSGGQSFGLEDLAKADFSVGFQRLWFPLLFIGFGVLAAMWPLHTWSPDGHASAPTAVSMLHAGVLMKLGAYGCLRVGLGLLPQGAMFWSPAIAALVLVGVIYGAIGAAAQKDLKYVTAYSSVSHMGLVLLGLATLQPLGVDGAVLQMFAHGIMTGLFFGLIGSVYGRTHTRDITKMGGLAKVMPFLAGAWVLAGMAGLGLPGLAGFVSELLVFLGAFNSGPWMKVLAVLAASSVVFTAFFVLRVVQRTFFGPMRDSHFEGLDDAHWNEKLALGILAGVLVAFGLFPQPLLRLIDPSVLPILQRMLPGGHL